MTKEDDKKIVEMIEKMTEKTGIKATKEQMKIALLIEEETNNFLDYVDARFDALKVDQAYKTALGISIASKILASLYHANPQGIQELSGHLQKAIIEEMENLEEIEKAETKK